MSEEYFFMDERLSFAEGRYSRHSSRLFKPHMHRRLSIGAVSSGDLSFCIDQDTICLSPGALAIINPDTLHSCNPAPVKPRSFYMLYLAPSWCRKIQNTLCSTEKFIPINTPCIKEVELYNLYIDTMQFIMAKDRSIPDKEQRLTVLAEFLFTRTCCSGTSLQQHATDADVLRLKRILSEELNQDIPLATAAAKLNANPYTLLRLFRRHTGITPHAYRMNCRIEHARQLLRQGNDITDTALQCGFFDQSHFHRHFKAMTTVTPGEYQRSLTKPS